MVIWQCHDAASEGGRNGQVRERRTGDAASCGRQGKHCRPHALRYPHALYAGGPQHCRRAGNRGPAQRKGQLYPSGTVPSDHWQRSRRLLRRVRGHKRHFGRLDRRGKEARRPAGQPAAACHGRHCRGLRTTYPRHHYRRPYPWLPQRAWRHALLRARA